MMFIGFDAVELYQNRKENCAQQDFGAFLPATLCMQRKMQNIFALYTKVPFPLH